MTEVALAAGFGSLRRFNEVFQKLFHRPPSSLRRRSIVDRESAESGTELRVRYRAPYDWDSMLRFLKARAIPGVEVVEGGVYRRAVEVEGAFGVVEVRHEPRRQSLLATIWFPTVQALPAIVNRVRRLFDVGADIETIDDHLSVDHQLAPWVARRPGLRAPGGWDGFELAVRAVLGQQVSACGGAEAGGTTGCAPWEAAAEGGCEGTLLDAYVSDGEAAGEGGGYWTGNACGSVEYTACGCSCGG